MVDGVLLALLVAIVLIGPICLEVGYQYGVRETERRQCGGDERLCQTRCQIQEPCEYCRGEGTVPEPKTSPILARQKESK